MKAESDALQRGSGGAAKELLGRLAQRGPATGDPEFFRDCARDLAEFFAVRHVFIGVFVDPLRTTIRSLVTLEDGQRAEDIEYSILGTPCMSVLHERQHLVPTDVQLHYPTDRELARLGVDSYFGIALGDSLDDNQGILALMDDKPMHLNAEQRSLVQTFAARIAQELRNRSPAPSPVVDEAHLAQEIADLGRDLTIAYSELSGLYDVITHEIRAPLRALQGFSAALAEEPVTADAERSRDYARRIHQAALRMDAQIDALERLRRIAVAQMTETPVDISLLMREVWQDLQDSGRYSRTPRLTLADGLAAQGDRYMLKELFYQLLDNAWKFTQQREDAEIKVGADTGGPETLFYVMDNGIGFEPRYSHKLFSPFHRLHSDPQYAGQGIGLSMAHRVVRRHGGTIWADAVPGQGTTLYFTLPNDTRRCH